MLGGPVRRAGLSRDEGRTMAQEAGRWYESDAIPSGDRHERVPTDSWDEIVGHYRRNYGDGCWGVAYRPMLRLVEEIAGSAYASVLFGKYTPPCNDHRGQLNLCLTRTLVKRHQMLAVRFVPADDWFLFEYYEAAYEPKPWATVCAASEGFAKLEWVFNKRLHWFRNSDVGRAGA